MGYQDRRYDEGKYNDGGSAARRILSASGSFFNWSIPLFTVPHRTPWIGGIHIRVHILYLLIAISELIKAESANGVGIAQVSASLATLFVLVLLHEFGHCVACRWVGGSADEILMWPLGGLAYCLPPRRWQSCLITTIGGPGINVILVPVLGAFCFLAGGNWSDLVYDPIHFHYHSIELSTTWWRFWLAAAYDMNLMLLLFNVLVPMYPMDSGRILQELLWAKIGYKRSMEIAVLTGFVVAVLLGVLAFYTGQMRLLGLAVFGGLTCYNERQRVLALEEQPAWAFDTDKGNKGFDNTPIKGDRKAEKALIKRQETERSIQEKVDKVLDKIREKGIGSLTENEKNILKDATQRTRSKS